MIQRALNWVKNNKRPIAIYSGVALGSAGVGAGVTLLAQDSGSSQPGQPDQVDYEFNLGQGELSFRVDGDANQMLREYIALRNVDGKGPFYDHEMGPFLSGINSVGTPTADGHITKSEVEQAIGTELARLRAQHLP